MADLGGFAEHYAYSDPAAALVKLRKFGENLTADFFAHYRILRPPKANFLELLRSLEDQILVPPVILNKLHAVRTQGNKAAHSNAPARPRIAMWILQESFDLAKWFALSVLQNDTVKFLEFAKPEGEESKGELKREKKLVLQKLAAQEAQMQKLLRELEDARKKAAAAEKSKEEQKTILASANQAANALAFDEKTTRELLIDQLLVQAGWDVAAGEESTAQVGKEVKVAKADGSKKGRADYVLYDDTNGKPLAVIEAKKTSNNAEKGRVQARFYADCLEEQYGQRPVIFYTNGYDIYIWDDDKADVPRRIYGFYSKDSLQYCLWKTKERKDLKALGPDHDIVDRPYQIEAVKRVCEKFDTHRRKALIVQATGTGKTRVAVSIVELLVRARWVKRVLFLCDRRELRKQANNAFAEFLPGESRVYVTSATAQERNRTIYLATYPAMTKCFQNFDVGFFDLIIADESHRSIYNRYRDLFLYFDALHIGLTATPRNIITHDTFRLFDCESNDPTAHYSYEDAVNHVPPYLAHFQVTKHTTKFLRDGIRYAEMTDEQKQELEEQLDAPQLVDYSAEQVDKAVFNKDTDRRIIRNLMDNGEREATGQHVGKTIIFARDHNHALQLRKLFEEMYPQYMKPKKEFCAVIDNYVDMAEQLIDDFKEEGSNDNLMIAISVDMLDTGIDVPAIVNLVFAKPVKSYVKFWQMIGRGTRLRENLFGPGKHKEAFRIFDHWGNFEYFGENPPEVQPVVAKSLLQSLFEARLDLAQEALAKQDLHCFRLAVGQIEQDVRALPKDSIPVREKWRQVETVLQPGVIKAFDSATAGTLRMEIAPLMQWRDLSGREDQYRFDLLVARMQTSLLRQSADFDNYRGDMQEQVSQLPVNIAQVAAKIKIIQEVKAPVFWNKLSATPVPQEDSDVAMVGEEGNDYSAAPVQGATPAEKLDFIRRELRGIMHCRNRPKTTPAQPLHIDVTDSGEETGDMPVKLEGLELAAYRHRVEHALKKVFDTSPVLQRIKAGKPVDDDDIQPLINAINATDPTLRMDDILIYFPNPANRLDLAIRQIIGLDAEAVNAHFTEFLKKYPGLTSHQMRFLALIQKHIINLGAREQLDIVQGELFKFFREDVVKNSSLGKYLQDAQCVISKPTLLQVAIKMINDLPLMQGDTKGDLYEYMLGKLTTAGVAGQFRTPRHIIRAMVEMLDVKPTETVCDPACGTAGFLIESVEHLRCVYSSPDLVHNAIDEETGEIVRDDHGNPIKVYPGDRLDEYLPHIQNGMFHGFDFDSTMLRIAAMNMLLHGIDNPAIDYKDTLSEQSGVPQQYEGHFDVVLANPPFKGSIDHESVFKGLTSVAKTRKTELLFLVLMTRILKTGGRCAIIVPDGVLFGSSAAHRAVRRMLVEDNQLEAVISLPSGVFKPYAGVSTAILVFTKAGRTDNVWFYKVEADGYSLDDKRTPVKDNDLPDLLTQWKRWKGHHSPATDNEQRTTDNVDFSDRTKKAFFVRKEEIVGNKYDLSINRYAEVKYEEVEYDPPEVILDRMEKLEKEIIGDMHDLRRMLAGKSAGKGE
ncbi:MAG: N-6 DNA methylase [Lentisphaeria bacterium]|nr:N-6 DNA methylase [Lentisphaeria bacterium]